MLGRPSARLPVWPAVISVSCLCLSLLSSAVCCAALCVAGACVWPVCRQSGSGDGLGLGLGLSVWCLVAAIERACYLYHLMTPWPPCVEQCKNKTQSKIAHRAHHCTPGRRALRCCSARRRVALPPLAVSAGRRRWRRQYFTPAPLCARSLAGRSRRSARSSGISTCMRCVLPDVPPCTSQCPSGAGSPEPRTHFAPSPLLFARSTRARLS